MTVVGIAAVALILGGVITWMVRRRKRTSGSFELGLK